MMILGGDLLKDGRVTNRGVKDVNIFDPSSNLLTPARNDMTLPRWYGTATTLPTGEVYIQGGTDGEKHPEIRKADGTFKALTIDTLAKIKVGPNEMAAFENNYPRNFVAPNGKIFGFDPHFMYEIDPYGNAGKGSVKMLGAHWDYPRITEDGKEDWEFYRGWQATSTAVMVRPGLIFQFGGGDMTGNMNNGGPSKATLIDINGDRPKLFDMPALDKTYHWSNATVLADGNVLVSGGSTKNLLVDVEEPINEDAGDINYATMLFNPDTRQWTPGANISEKRLYHSVTLLLPDATVLSTGGGQPGPVDNLNAQIYRPPYLFNADGTLAKRPVLKGEETVRLREPVEREPRSRSRKRTSSTASTLERDLDAAGRACFDRLRSWRSQQARDSGVPAYVIFHDATLHEIAQRRPTTLHALAAVPGVGEKKLETYGEAVLEVVADGE